MNLTKVYPSILSGSAPENRPRQDPRAQGMYPDTYLAHKEPPPPPDLQEARDTDPVAVLRGGGGGSYLRDDAERGVQGSRSRSL